MRILANQTANGSGASFPVTANFTVFVDGANFDTSTVDIEISPNETDWFIAEDEQGNAVTFTAKGSADVSYSNGSIQWVRATVSSVGGSTDVGAMVLTAEVIK